MLLVMHFFFDMIISLCGKIDHTDRKPAKWSSILWCLGNFALRHYLVEADVLLCTKGEETSWRSCSSSRRGFSMSSRAGRCGLPSNLVDHGTFISFIGSPDIQVTAIVQFEWVQDITVTQNKGSSTPSCFISQDSASPVCSPCSCDFFATNSTKLDREFDPEYGRKANVHYISMHVL